MLRETWLIYKNTKLVKRVNAGKVRDHQRKFLQALQALRKVKLDQRKLSDNANQLIDIGKLHTQIAERMDESQEEQTTMMQRIESLEDKIGTLQKSLDLLPQILVDRLLRHVAELSRLPQADLTVAMPMPMPGSMTSPAVTDAAGCVYTGSLAENLATDC